MNKTDVRQSYGYYRGPAGRWSGTALHECTRVWGSICSSRSLKHVNEYLSYSSVQVFSLKTSHIKVLKCLSCSLKAINLFVLASLKAGEIVSSALFACVRYTAKRQLTESSPAFAFLYNPTTAI